jgi:DNA-binding transcriptional LysR family regulator
MIRGLKNEKYDVIFGSYVEDEPDIQFVPILNQEMIIITPVGHPLSKKEQVSIHDLEHYPLIGYDRTSGLGRFTSRTYTSYTLHPNIICESPDENAIASLVAEDFGIGFVAHVESLQAYDVEILHLSNVKPYHTVYMAYLKNMPMIPAVRKFIEFTKETIDIFY